MHLPWPNVKRAQIVEPVLLHPRPTHPRLLERIGADDGRNGREEQVAGLDALTQKLEPVELAECGHARKDRGAVVQATVGCAVEGKEEEVVNK